MLESKILKLTLFHVYRKFICSARVILVRYITGVRTPVQNQTLSILLIIYGTCNLQKSHDVEGDCFPCKLAKNELH